MTKDNGTDWGGKREGAGRPKAEVGSQSVMVRLDTLEKLQKVSGKTYNEKIKSLFAELEKKEKLLAQIKETKEEEE